tara:strand:- start:580 stop:1458 length:879 start_codon:yes stop_codon:yes gene_type:complete
MASIVKKLKRLPEWLKTPLPKKKQFFELKSLVQKYNLNTVCESASCPNIGECWDAGTLTLMILGNSCSRACKFCDVATGNLFPPNPEEPKQIAEILSQLNLRYAVITSVDRDDLPDGGAEHWIKTIKIARSLCPGMKIEALIPDFQGNMDLVEKICDAGPDLIAHNLETVESIQHRIRPQCRYSWSLATLKTASLKKDLIVKSSLMLGLGEKENEVINTMKDLVDTGCQILSLGQYLRPSPRHAEVIEFIHPNQFLRYKQIGESLGLAHVEAGPLVRSSYMADQQAKAVGIF